MPQGDKTGPQGEGAMTGRKLGFCTGNDSPGFENGFSGGRRAFGRRKGNGLGRGRGRGFNRTNTNDNLLSSLSERIAVLEKKLS